MNSDRPNILYDIFFWEYIKTKTHNKKYRTEIGLQNVRGRPISYKIEEASLKKHYILLHTNEQITQYSALN